MIYFDHASTTQIDPKILDILIKDLASDFANPASAHRLGKGLNSKLSDAKNEILNILGADYKKCEFFFTSGATESNNTVVKGLELNEEDIVIYSKADHKSLVTPIENLVCEKVSFSIEDLNNLLNSKASNLDSKKVKLIALTLVNSQSGEILNVETIKKLRDIFSNAHIHLDIVQAIGKIPFKYTDFKIDSCSLSAHKFGGPKGTGGLVLNKNHKIKPLIEGGEQQNNFRAGTEAYPLEMAFYTSLKNAFGGQETAFKKVSLLENEFKKKVKEIIPTVEFPFINCSPFIVCFILKGLSSDIIIRHLEMKNVYISSTSACSSKIKGFNSTLHALGIEEYKHKSVLRVSFSPNSTEEELNIFLKEFATVWNDIRHLIK